TPATPGPAQFAIRVLNLAPSLAGSIRAITDTLANSDAFILGRNVFPSGAPAFTNLPFNTPSAYINVDTGGYRLALTTTGPTDSTIARTGTGASSGVTAAGVILVSGANETQYNGWQEVLSVNDTLICSPSDPGDVVTGNKQKCAPPADTTLASADTARTIFRFRYRIVGAPATPGTGTVVYRQYPAAYTASDFATPQIIFVVDKRP